MICFAQGSSWARVAGRQLKIRRRLGVSPDPVALYGPVTVNVSKCGWPDVSRVSVELRMNGCRRVGLVASLRAMNAAPMTCGPAVSFRRMRPALVDGVAGLRHVHEVGLEVGFAAHAERVHARAVHRVLDVVLVLEAAHHAEVRAEHLHGELILGVERQRDLREDAADRADGLAFDVRVLRRVLADVERLARDADVGIADGQRADLVRGLHEALEEHRRHAEHVADVVEAVRGVVRRQQRRGIDVEREQIAHRVGVLGAIQAVQHRPAGIRLRRRRRDRATS